MAITINQQASVLSPCYNDMMYVVVSDKTAQDNFKYVCDIYINGSYVHRKTAPPHPTLGVGVFNAARVVESYISGNFDYALTGVTQCVDSIAIVQCKFGEEYGLSTTGTTVYTNLASTAQAVSWNGVFDFEDWCSYSRTPYSSLDSSSIFLTNSPVNKPVYRDDKEYLYAINRTSGDIYYFQVETSDSSPSSIGSYRIYNSFQAVTNYYDRMVRCPAGWNMNDISAANITVDFGSLPIMTTNVASYTIKCVKYDGTTTIGEKHFVNDTNCDRFTKYRLHFLNKLGGYDSFSFTKKSTFKSDIKRENFKSNLGELVSSTTYTHSKSQRAVTQYATNISDNIKVTSDWVSSGDIQWLEELVTSPDVYVERNGAAIPINITDSSFDRQNGEDKKLFNLTLEFEYSYKRYRQRF